MNYTTTSNPLQFPKSDLGRGPTNLHRRPAAARSKPKKSKEREPVLQPGHYYQEGEFTLDGLHRYCSHQDIFWDLQHYDFGHVPGTTLFMPSAQANAYLANLDDASREILRRRMREIDEAVRAKHRAKAGT